MDIDKAWWRPLFRNLRKLGEEEEALAANAHVGMLQGDLLPLAAFLKTGHELHPLLRRRLVEMIEGNPATEYVVTSTKVRAGRGDSVSRLHAWGRRQDVAAFVHDLEHTHGKREAAVQAACDMFGVSRSYVFDALRETERNLRSLIAEDPTTGGSD